MQTKTTRRLLNSRGQVRANDRPLPLAACSALETNHQKRGTFHIPSSQSASTFNNLWALPPPLLCLRRAGSPNLPELPKTTKRSRCCWGTQPSSTPKTKKNSRFSHDNPTCNKPPNRAHSPRKVNGWGHQLTKLQILHETVSSRLAHKNSMPQHDRAHIKGKRSSEFSKVSSKHNSFSLFPCLNLDPSAIAAASRLQHVLSLHLSKVLLVRRGGSWTAWKK